MPNRSSIFIMIASLLSLGSVQAATISYQSRFINNGVNQSDYKVSWSSQTSAINTQAIPDFTHRLGGNNTFSHLLIDFDSTATKLSFDLAVDAGYGGAIYLDNNLVTKDTTDLWWGYDWNNTSEILSVKDKTISFGNHILEVFWAEGCCNGYNSGRFSIGDTKQWQTISSANLEALKPVPVPAAIWLFGSAIIGLLTSSRKGMFKMTHVTA